MTVAQLIKRLQCVAEQDPDMQVRSCESDSCYDLDVYAVKVSSNGTDTPTCVVLGRPGGYKGYK